MRDGTVAPRRPTKDFVNEEEEMIFKNLVTGKDLERYNREGFCVVPMPLTTAQRKKHREPEMLVCIRAQLGTARNVLIRP